MRVVVVGAGVMGAASARALAHRGHDVTLLEQFDLGHARGSSHGTARYRQLAAYPTTDYLELGIRARRLWAELEEESGARILHRTGNISIGDAAELERQRKALTNYGADAELISGADVDARWPSMSLPDDEPVLLQEDGEVIAADVALEAFIDSGRNAGAKVIEGCRVASVDETTADVVVGTDGASMTADRVVITAGPWVGPLAAAIGIDMPVTVTRQTVAYFPWTGDRPPTVTDFGGNEPYSLWDPLRGLKAAEHRAGPEADPNVPDDADEKSVRRVTEWVRSLFTDVEPEPHLVETCLYTNAPGDRIILERRGRIVVASPCSGQGFQFSPAIGEQLADLACS